MILNTPVTDRYALMDAARGFAILGILIANIFIFGLPYQALSIPEIWGAKTALNSATWDFVTIFVDGVMRCMISILFGAAIVIQLSNAEKQVGERGLRALDPFFRRLLWLIAFGLIHAYLLLWPYDILYLYGLFGLLLFPFRNWSVRALSALAAVMLAASVLTGTNGASVLYDAQTETAGNIQENAADMGEIIEPFVFELPDTDASPEELLVPDANDADVALLEGVEDEMAAIISDMEEEMNARRAGYVSNLTSLAEESFVEQTSEVFRHHFLDVTTMMIVGMALLKAGFLTGAWPVRRYAAIAIVSYPLATLIGALSGWTVENPTGMEVLSNALADYGYDPHRLLFALGHLSVLAILVKTGALRFVMVRLQACGRMALSLYIAQTLVCITLFFGFGFGLFGRMEHVDLLLLGFALVLVQFFAAHIYLARFRQGPLEWLLRRLSQGNPAPPPAPRVVAEKRRGQPAE